VSPRALKAARPAAEPDAVPGRVHFDLTTVRLFIATAESGSITRAAERIAMAPAAVSRRMKELEAQFGVPLFQRLPHGMALTDAGRTLLAHARSVAHAVSRMQDDAQAFRQGDKGVVRIAACTSTVLQFLPEDIQRCHAAYPGIKIDLQEINSQGVLQAVSRGVVDLGIYESTQGGLPLPARHYHEDRLVLVVHASHALASRRSVRLDDFLPYDVIGLTQGSAISTTLARMASEAQHALRMRIHVGSFDSMTAMIAQGIGIGVMPQAVAQTFAGGRAFKRLRIDDSWAARRFTLCHQPVASMSSAALTVAAMLCPREFANRES
jgi:DNA-binding transcriptional LysR family regulator